MCNMVYELTGTTMEQSGLISIVVGVAQFGLVYTQVLVRKVNNDRVIAEINVKQEVTK